SLPRKPKAGRASAPARASSQAKGKVGLSEEEVCADGEVVVLDAAAVGQIKLLVGVLNQETDCPAVRHPLETHAITGRVVVVAQIPAQVVPTVTGLDVGHELMVAAQGKADAAAQAIHPRAEAHRAACGAMVEVMGFLVVPFIKAVHAQHEMI